MLPTPRFHHLHLSSVDPEAAIDVYVREFSRSRATRWGGLPALAAPTDVPLTEATCRVERGPERSWPALDREGMFRVPSAAVVFERLWTCTGTVHGRHRSLGDGRLVERQVARSTTAPMISAADGGNRRRPTSVARARSFRRT